MIFAVRQAAHQPGREISRLGAVRVRATVRSPRSTAGRRSSRVAVDFRRGRSRAGKSFPGALPARHPRREPDSGGVPNDTSVPS